jgi:hypothetical protein
MSPPPQPSVALLLGEHFDYMLTLVMALGAARFGDADPAVPTAAPRPLPTMHEGEVVLVGSAWAERASARGIDVARQIIPDLRRRFDRVIGLDQETSCQLQFSDDVFRALDVVIKPNALYRDLDLYSWQVGTDAPEGRWTEKVTRRATTLSTDDLAKLHLSVPSLTIVGLEARALARRYHRPFAPARWARDLSDRALAFAVRPIRPDAPPHATAHFLGTLSNMQRLDMLQRLARRHIRAIGGLTGISATVFGSAGRSHERLALDVETSGFAVPRQGRLRYRMGIASAKAVVSIAGHGEICFRMAEAWGQRRLLVCQDLSHLRTLYPFENRRNVIFCRPDLSDLADILDDVECNVPRYVPIAEQGYSDWREWSRRVPELLREGFSPILGAA